MFRKLIVAMVIIMPTIGLGQAGYEIAIAILPRQPSGFCGNSIAADELHFFGRVLGSMVGVSLGISFLHFIQLRSNVADEE